MGGHARHSVHSEKEKLVISFSGDISEFFESDLNGFKIPPHASIVFDFKEVTSVNSTGVKAWLSFMSKMTSDKIIFRNCPSSVVMMVNYCPMAVGNGSVASIYGDFYCLHCDEESQHLFELTEDVERLKERCQTLTCHRCQSILQFDNVEEIFFNFVNEVKVG